MTVYTIYWSHPYEGEGAFVLDALNADAAIEETVENLASDFIREGEEYDYLERYLFAKSLFIDDLICEAFPGDCHMKPSGKPAAELT